MFWGCSNHPRNLAKKWLIWLRIFGWFFGWFSDGWNGPHSIPFRVQLLFDLNMHWALFWYLGGRNGRVLVYFCLGHTGNDVVAFTSFWWPRPIEQLYLYSLLLCEIKEIFYEVIFFTTGANWDAIVDEQWIFIVGGSVFIIQQSIYSQKSTTQTVHFVSCCDRIYIEILFVWYPWIVMRHDCHCGLVGLRSESILFGIDIHFFLLHNNHCLS
jgi:hypothetical protein